MVVQHVDIMPGILDYLNYPENFCSIGESFLRPLPERYAFNYIRDIYQIEDEQYALQFDGYKATGMYNYQNDPLLKNNILNQFPEDPKRLTERMKTTLQIFEQALVNNKLTHHD